MVKKNENKPKNDKKPMSFSEMAKKPGQPKPVIWFMIYDFWWYQCRDDGDDDEYIDYDEDGDGDDQEDEDDGKETGPAKTGNMLLGWSSISEWGWGWWWLQWLQWGWRRW